MIGMSIAFSKLFMCDLKAFTPAGIHIGALPNSGSARTNGLANQPRHGKYGVPMAGKSLLSPGEKETEKARFGNFEVINDPDGRPALFPGHDRCAQNYHRALRGRRRGASTFPRGSASGSETIASPHRATLRLWRDEWSVALRDGILRWRQPGRL